MNKRVGLAELFIYYKKNKDLGGFVFILLHEKKKVNGKILEKLFRGGLFVYYRLKE